MTGNQTFTPAQFDAAELGLMKRLAKSEQERDALAAEAHRKAGDTRSYSGFGRNRVVSWQLTDTEAIEASGMRLLFANATYQVTSLRTNIADMEAIYREDPWNRYYPCLNRDGHIHSSERGCQTVYWDTDMGWAVEMSGLSPDEAIHGRQGEFAGLGETLCSVCFPDAPAAWCRTRSEVTRAEREAAKAAKTAARDAALAVKNLAEVYVTYDGDKVRTVAEAKRLIRQAVETRVELEWLKSADGRNAWQDDAEVARRIVRAEERLAGETGDSLALTRILAEREAAAPGSGWTYADSQKAVEAKLRSARREWFR